MSKDVLPGKTEHFVLPVSGYRSLMDVLLSRNTVEISFAGFVGSGSLSHDARQRGNDALVPPQAACPFALPDVTILDEGNRE